MTETKITMDRTCPRCKHVKPADQFEKTRTICRKCHHADQSAAYDRKVASGAVKHCSSCQQTLPLGLFYPQTSRCKTCFNKKASERWYARHPPKPVLSEARCNRCEQLLPVDDFCRNKVTRKGWTQPCRPCHLAKYHPRKTPRAETPRAAPTRQAKAAPSAPKPPKVKPAPKVKPPTTPKAKHTRIAVSDPQKVLAAINTFQSTATSDPQAFSRLAQSLRDIGLDQDHAAQILEFQLRHPRCDTFRDEWTQHPHP